MPYVTTAERRGIEQGHAEGQCEELVSTIELLLNLRFGAAGLALLPEISQITEYSLLRAIRDQILTVDQPEDLRPIYQQLCLTRRQQQ